MTLLGVMLPKNSEMSYKSYFEKVVANSVGLKITCTINKAKTIKSRAAVKTIRLKD